MWLHNCKWQLTVRGVTVVALCLFAARVAMGQRADNHGEGQPSRPNTLETRVESFSATGVSRLHALIQLGQQLKLPLGIECVEPGIFKTVPAVSLAGRSLREVVRSILGDKQEYELRLTNGVLDIRCAKRLSTRDNLFETVVPHFSISRVNLTTASLNLRMALELRLRPQTRGFAGDYAPAPLGHDVGPLEMSRATVRQMLDTIVGSYGEAAWVATVSPSRMDHLPPAGLWAIIDYKDPRWADSVRALAALFVD